MIFLNQKNNTQYTAQLTTLSIGGHLFWLWRKRPKSAVSTMRGIPRSSDASFQTKTKLPHFIYAKQPCLNHCKLSLLCDIREDHVLMVHSLIISCWVSFWAQSILFKIMNGTVPGRRCAVEVGLYLPMFLANIFRPDKCFIIHNCYSLGVL